MTPLIQLGEDLTITPLKNMATITPEVDSTINAEDLKKTPEPIIPETGSNLNLYQKIVDNSNKTLDYSNLIKEAQTPTVSEQKQSTLTEQLKSALEGTLGKSADLVKEESKLGVNRNVNQLQNINQQIAQLQSGLNLGLSAEETRPVARTFMTGRQAEMQRQSAVEIGSLATVAQALQGNITLAKQTAQDTVNAKYADAEQKVKNLQDLIDVNYKQMTVEQQRKADTLNVKLKQRQDEIDKQKENDTNKNALMIKAAENGADQTTLNNIINAKDYSSAISAAKDYLNKDIESQFTKVGTDENGNDIYGFVDTVNNKVYDVQGNNITTNPSTTVSPTEGSISYRTNNPGNIKWTGAAWQTALGATNSGIKASDGGTFAMFPTVEAGTEAQKQLLTSGSYANLTVDAAMKRWSNNGYGADVSSINGGKLMKDLTPQELSTLMADMKEREGWFEATTPTINNLTDQEQYFYDSLKQRRQKYSQLNAADKKIADAAFRKMNEVMPRQLSMTEEAAQTSAIDGLNAVQTLRDMANNNEMPLLRSYIFGDTTVGRFLGTSQFEQAKKTASDIITRIRTGAALNESEVKFYQTMTPALGDTQEDITKKLNNLYALYAGISGLPVVVLSPDGTQQVEFNDLYSPLQRQGLRDALENNWTPQ